jgi:hypothetical protein
MIIAQTESLQARNYAQNILTQTACIDAKDGYLCPRLLFSKVGRLLETACNPDSAKNSGWERSTSKNAPSRKTLSLEKTKAGESGVVDILVGLFSEPCTPTD